MSLKIYASILVSALTLVACGGGGGGSTSSGSGGGGTTAPAVSVSPTSIAFGSQTVGTSSAAQTVTLTNSGNASLSISSISLTGTNAGDYAETTTCGSSLAASAHCTISVTFTPTAASATTAAVSLSTNAAGSPTSVALTGTGTSSTPAVSVSPASIAFGSQAVGTSSAAQTVTVTNSGNATLSISSISLAGTNASDYTETSTCGSSLAASATCTISLTFKPAAAISSSATVSIATNAAGSPTSIALTGIGTSTTAGNSFPITIDQGPIGITNTVNVAYATITICTPGSTSQCTTIDHIQVDTGSYGLRLFSTELGAAVPTSVTDPASGNAINECVIYADGYTWGSVGKVDLTLGNRTIPGVAAQVLSDTKAGAPPNTCSHTGTTSNGTYENTVTAFGAKGLIGIGPFAQDCGSYCAQSAQPQWYYTCPSGACSPIAVPVANQVQNPITLLSADNNGVVIDLPAVTAGVGQATLQGTVYFGVSTQSNNTPSPGTGWYTLTNIGTLSTTYKQASLPNSFIDLGSNGLFFGDSAIPTCTTSTGFYCPTNPLNLSATITGANGTQTTASFTVDNADADFNANPSFGVFKYIAGNNSSPTAPSNAFDWGSPFFFGRRIYHLFEGQTVGTVTGPALAF